VYEDQGPSDSGTMCYRTQLRTISNDEMINTNPVIITHYKCICSSQPGEQAQKSQRHSFLGNFSVTA
jgi:hypothetical protein